MKTAGGEGRSVGFETVESEMGKQHPVCKVSNAFLLLQFTLKESSERQSLLLQGTKGTVPLLLLSDIPIFVAEC